MSRIIASTYEIIKKLGAGGGGRVYLAQHLRLKKKVVLKIDKRKLSAKPEFLRREVDILKELSHPYIPRVYDFFVEGEDVYTVMDYIEGESLDKALKRGERFSQVQVIQWAVQLLDALCYLHSPIHGESPKGYAHSDIKPANLMRTPQGDVCLIDFNIALALGEEGVIGCSAGYASPEHYGLDFSSKYDEEHNSRFGESISGESMLQREDDILTVTIAAEPDNLSASGVSYGMSGASDMQRLSDVPGASGISGMSGSSGSLRKRLVMPDVRSDVYSVGATLYHLLSGTRPSKNAVEVIPLSSELFSSQVVRIISKAMNPNPNLRYQTAREMKSEFLNLRKQDPRMRRWRKRRRIASVVFPMAFLLGGLAAFTGLKRMQSMEKWLKMTEYAQTALEKGDVEEATEYARQILSESSDRVLPGYVPGIQRILVEAAGIYDLSDGYKIYKTIELPSAPHYMVISPDGGSASALCGHQVVIFDTVSAEVIAELPAEPSAISQIRYLDDSTVLYAGEGGITAYDLKGGCELWEGDVAAMICISGDGKSAAGIGEGETYATVYDTKTGEIRCKVDFAGKSQNIGIKDNLFALNSDGTLLAVSFQDGSLKVYGLSCGEKGTDISEEEMVIYQPDSGYTHFEGGFHEQYFAFGASGREKSTFAVVDTAKGEEAGGFQAESVFGVQADESGIYVQSDNILVKLNPVTGEQIPLVTMDESIIRFAMDGMDTVVTTKNEMYFFDEKAQMMSRYQKEYVSDLVGMAEGMAVIGSMDRPVVRIMQYEENPESEIFTYDADYQHDEARVSEDGETLMLFSYRQFRIYGKDGMLIKEVDIPDADRVIDQQFIRKEKESYLEVIYEDGKTDIYSAADGTCLREEMRKRTAGKEDALEEEFIIDDLRIESPLHGTPIVYDKKTKKEIARLKEETYLTYVTKIGDYMAAQYAAVNGENSGQLLSKECEVLAELPYLSDVTGENLIFDYPTGSIRQTKIYDIEEIVNLTYE